MIEEATNKDWNVCLYGLGNLGRRLHRRIAEMLSLRIDSYCDRSAEAVAAFALLSPTGAKAVTIEELCAAEHDILVLVLVDDPADLQIRSVLTVSPYLHPLLLREILGMDAAMLDFYGETFMNRYRRLPVAGIVESAAAADSVAGGVTSPGCSGRLSDQRPAAGKIAVYTCITGGYDRLKRPEYLESCCDYYVISDDRAMAGDHFTWICVDDVVPDRSMGAKDKNRYCKMHPHRIFPGYAYAIYLDGSMKLTGPISRSIRDLGESGLAMHRHRSRDCLYLEAIFVEWLGVAERSALLREMRRYLDEGMPRRFGLFECGIIVSALGNQTGRRIMERWFELYLEGAGRDQCALPYVLWKLKLDAEMIGQLCGGKDILSNPYVDWIRNHHNA